MSWTAEPTRTYYNEGQQIIAERVDKVVYISQTVRERVEAQALTAEQVDYLREVYVRSPAGEGAIMALNERHAVALVGPPGCGRRITGVHAITELHAVPHPIYLDPTDTRRDLPADKGCGYIVDIDEQTVRDMPGLTDMIATYRDKLAAAGAYLTVTATRAAWNAFGPQTGMVAVPVQPPRSAAVFGSHLRHRRSDEAERWISHRDVLDVLQDAEPGDAVRLAELADASLASASGEDAIQQALNAYRNWSAQLSGWFKENDEGYSRALLISAAALNGAEASTVFAAADRLSQAVKLQRPSGGGLIGDGVAELLVQIGADLTDDGRIRLPRPAFPESILDYVWGDRPHLRADLRRWLVDLPGGLRTPTAEYAGYALIDLAVRQADSTLITDAVSAWAEQPGCRALAVTALTESGVSDSIGRTVRRTMYGWASGARTAQSVRITVAEVCGGPYGKSFPRNAMTRLRHLSLNGDVEVHDHVVAALLALAEESALRDVMLQDIIGWTKDDSRICLPGIRAFLALGEGGGVELLRWTFSDPGKLELLADGLRAALHHPVYRDRAREMCRDWLESTAQGTLPAEIVTDVLAHTCKSSSDIGTLASLVWQWGHAGGRPTTPDHEKVCAQLLQKAAERDPLARGVSATVLYQAVQEDGQ
jgi:hypothetical protein